MTDNKKPGTKIDREATQSYEQLKDYVRSDAVRSIASNYQISLPKLDLKFAHLLISEPKKNPP